MIAILSASNLVCHIAEVLDAFLPYEFTSMVSGIFNTALLFTIMWSSCIAFLVSNSVSKDKMNNPKRYFNYSLLVFVSLSTILCISWNIWAIQKQQKVFMFLLYPHIISWLFVITFYLKSLQSMKKYPAPIRNQMRGALQKLFFYPFAQLLIMTPSTVSLYFLYKQENMSALASALAELPLSLLGFVNALICAFQQKKLQTSSKSTVIIDDLDQSVSSIGNESDSSESMDYKEI